MNNPLCNEFKQQSKSEQNEKDHPNKGRRKGKIRNRKNDKSNFTDDKEQTFIGFAAKPGPTALRSKYKLKVQANLHHKNVNTEKKEKKKLKKMKPIKTIEKDPGEVRYTYVYIKNKII